MTSERLNTQRKSVMHAGWQGVSCGMFRRRGPPAEHDDSKAAPAEH